MIQINVYVTRKALRDEDLPKLISDAVADLQRAVHQKIFKDGYDNGYREGLEEGQEQGYREGKLFQNANDIGMANVKRRRG